MSVQPTGSVNERRAVPGWGVSTEATVSGRIPRQFIDDLLARVDIVDVVDERVPLKKAGRDFKACCPFHAEKTPSFTVSSAKQFYHCFGCGAHGTVIGFLMDYAHMDFVEAVEELARRAGVEVPHERGQTRPRDDTEPLYELLARASAYYQRQLRQHSQAQGVVDYLKARGLSGEVAAQYKLGFAPPGWHNIESGLGSDESTRALLLSAGLLIRRDDGGTHDRFRNRVMFPILDRRGRTIGFGGRVLGDETPKYLNSPETPVFHKGRELYGLYQARSHGRRLERLLVVEGYMDVLGLAQVGIHNAVATLGTAATEEHLKRLFPLCPDVVFCFDGDEAGRRAAWRALENALPQMRDGRQASFMFLSEGEDPDSLVRARGRSEFEAETTRAASLGTFLFDHLTSQVDLSNLDGRSRLVELARPLLERLPPGSFQALCARRLVEISGMDFELSTTLNSGRGQPGSVGRKSPRNRAARGTPPLVRSAITMMLHLPERASSAVDTGRLGALRDPGAELLLELIELLREHPNLSTGAVVERFREHEEGRHLAKLATEFSPPLTEGLRQDFSACIEKLAHYPVERRRQELRAKVRSGDADAAERAEFLRLCSGQTAHEPDARGS